MDEVVLVNDNDEAIGTALKATVHTQNTPLHRGFSVFLFNQNGQLLLQKRARGKTFAHFWSNSCCGHPKKGEKYEDAAKRRIKDELGITEAKVTTLLPNFRYVAEDGEIMENEICPVMVAFSNQEPTPDRSEVEEFKWISWIDFLAEINGNQECYSSWCREEAQLLEQNPIFHKLLSSIEPNLTD